MKKVLSLVFVLMLMTLLPKATAQSFESVAPTGQTLTYYLDNGEAVLNGYTGTLSGALTIPSSVMYENVSYSVTRINSWAFSSCSGMTSVTIPASITTIGYYAFGDCSGLTRANYGGTIDQWVAIDFEWYSNPLHFAQHLYIDNQEVVNLVIPEGVTTIKQYAFYGCTGLETVTFPSSLDSVGSEAFQNCSGLARIYCSSLVDWCNIAFTNGSANPVYYARKLYVGNTRVTNLVIPQGVTAIKPYAFYRLSNQTSVVLPEGLQSIGYYAFWDCDWNTEYTIPSTVTSIADHAIYGGGPVHYNAINCTVTNPNNNTWDLSALPYIYTLVVGPDVQYIPRYLLPYYEGYVSTLKMRCPPPTVANFALDNLPASTVIQVPCGMAQLYSTADTWSELPNTYQETTPYNLTFGCYEHGGAGYNQTPTCTLPAIINAWPDNGYHFVRWSDGVTDNPRTITLTQDTVITPIFAEDFYDSIADGVMAYYYFNGEGLTLGGINGTINGALVIPDSVIYDGSLLPVTKIWTSGFHEQRNMTSVTLPKNLNYVNDFYECTGLTRVYFNGTIEQWCAIDFDYWASNPCHYAHNLYIGGSAVTNLVIPEGVTSIGKYAFYGLSNLTTVTLPSTLDTVCPSAFEGCNNLTRTYYNGTVAQWCGIGFYDGWGSNPTARSGNLYIGGSKITNLVIPEGVTVIKPYAFYSQHGINSVVLPEGLQRIGKYAFSCNYNFTIPSTVTSIGENAITAGGTVYYNAVNCTNMATNALPNFFTVVVGENVQSLPINLFTVNINSLRLNCDPPQVESNAFDRLSENARVKVKCGKLSLYQQNTTWSTLGSRLSESNTYAIRFALSEYADAEVRQEATCTTPATVYAWGYNHHHFLRWSDGVTDNPRTIDLTQDTLLTPVVVIDTYYVVPTVCNDWNDRGYVTGGDTVEAGGTVTIAAYANTGYHFTGWSDGNGEAVRTYEPSYSDNICANFEVVSYELGQLYYRYNGSGMVVTGHNGDIEGHLVIPDTVTFEGVSYPVVGIDSWAIHSQNNMTAITLPATIDSLGEYALAYNNSLTAVYYTGTLAQWCHIWFENREANPLNNAHHLYIGGEEVINPIIPEGVTSIGQYAFRGGNQLANITLPSTLQSIGFGAFEDCNSLGRTRFTGTVSQWCNIDFSEPSSNPIYYSRNFFLGNSRVTDLVIPAGVTEIKPYSFYRCNSLNSVTMSDDILTVGMFAFQNCENLTAVNFSSNLTYIDMSAFQNCSSVSHFDLPASLEAIDSWAFWYCWNAVVTIPAGVTAIGSEAIYTDRTVIFNAVNCTNMANNAIPYNNTIVVGEGVQVLPYGLINNNITTLKMQCTPPTVQNFALDRLRSDATIQVACGLLSLYQANDEWNEYNLQEANTYTLTFDASEHGYASLSQGASCTTPAIVSAWSNTNGWHFARWADGNTDNPREIVLTQDTMLTPVFVEDFYDTLPDGSIFYYYYNGAGLTLGGVNGTLTGSVEIPDSIMYEGTMQPVTAIDGWVFYEQSGMTAITLPKGLTRMGPSIFNSSYQLTRVTFRGSLDQWCNINFEDWWSNPISAAHNLYLGNTRIHDIVIPEGITVLKQYVFNNLQHVGTVTLPEGLQRIERYALHEVYPSNNSFTIPSTVTAIGEWAMSMSPTLRFNAVSCTEVASNACPNTNILIVGDSVQFLPTNILTNNLWRLKMMCPPPTVEENALVRLRPTAEVLVKCGLLSLYQADSEWGSTNLMETSVYTITFSTSEHGSAGINQEGTCTTPATISAWSNNGWHFSHWADGNNENPRDIFLTQDTVITPVFVEDFYDTLPDGSIFHYYYNGVGLTLSGVNGTLNGIVTIPDSVMYEGQMLPVTQIDGSVFSSQSGMTWITLPKGLTRVGCGAFDNCSSLTRVNWGGTIADWCNIDFECWYSNPISYARHLFMNGSEVVNLVVPEGITEIKKYAFMRLSSLASVTLPSTLDSIDYNAFNECNGLQRTNFTGTVADWCRIGFNNGWDCNPISYSRNLYIGGEAVRNLVVPEGVTAIKPYAFYGLSDLRTVEFPEGLLSIGHHAFEYSSWNVNFTIPSTVARIEEYAIQSGQTLYYNAVNCNVMANAMPNFYTVYVDEGVQSLPLYLITGNIRHLRMQGYPPSVTGDVLDRLDSTAVVYVPCGLLNTYQTTPVWQDANLVESNTYALRFGGAPHGNAGITIEPTCTTSTQVTAWNDSYYHFVRWTDGNTDNPRTITLTQDTVLTPVFVIDTYYVCGFASPSDAYGSVEGCDTVTALDTFSLIAHANYGYHFLYWDHWTDTNRWDDSVLTLQAIWHYNIAAYFEPNNYAVSLSVDETTPYGQVAADTAYYPYLTEVTVAATPDHGYHFVSWNDGNTDNPRTLTLTQDTAFTASFAISQFDVNGMAMVLEDSQADSIGNMDGSFFSFNFEDGGSNWTLSNNNYVNRWYIANLEGSNNALFISNDNGATNSYDGTQPSDVYAYTSLYLPAGQYSYSYDWRCNGESSYDYLRVALVPDGTYFQTSWGTTSVPDGAIALDGGHKLNLNSDWTLQNGTIDVATEGNYYLVFYWRNDNSVMHTPAAAVDNITLSMGQTLPSPIFSGTCEVTGNDTVDYLDSVTLTAVAGYGYHFIKWSDGATENPHTVVADRSKTVYAIFGYNHYTLTVNVNNAAYGSASDNNAADDNYLSLHTLTANSNYGYHFSQWNDGVTVNPRTVTLTQDTAFTASFDKNIYDVTALSANLTMGNALASETSAEYLDYVTFTATPNYGYHFTQWNDGNTNNPRTVQVTDNITFTAQFDYNIYNVTLAVDDVLHGTVSGDSASQYLSTRTISATPNYGYHFTSWNDGVTDNPRTFTLTCDTAFTAQFAPNTVSLYLSVNDAALGTVSGAGNYLYLDTAFISATCTAAHHHFVQWSDGVTASSREIIFDFDSSLSLTAIFAIDSHSVVTLTRAGSADGVFDNDACGSITVDDGSGLNALSFPYGATLTLQPVASEGYHFAEWDNGDRTPVRTVTITSDTLFAVVFTDDVTPNLCMVSVQNGRNVLGWPKDLEVQRYNIYREANTAGVYAMIASIPYDSVSIWIDTTSRPTTRSYRYKMTATDIYGYESDFGTVHKTMHLTISQGIGTSWNLVWTEYEGADYTTYVIYRGTNAYNIEQIDIMPSGGNTTYTDEDAPTGDVYYQVGIILANPCNPSKSSNIVLSNIATNGSGVGVSDVIPDNVEIFSVDGRIIVQGAEGNDVYVYDVNGRVIDRKQDVLSTVEFRLSASGVYFVKVGKAPARRVVVIR